MRRPEGLRDSIMNLRREHPEYADVADVATICIESSSTNDYLEKIGAESIGARHLTSKLGPDGELEENGVKVGIEIKPKKSDSAGIGIGGVINDDTPMKLKKTFTEYKYIVFLNASKSGTLVHWALCAPIGYWSPQRFKKIVQALQLLSDPEWKWGESLPSDPVQHLECLDDLVKKHKQKVYIRSSELSLDVVKTIPKSELVFWKHPDVPKAKLCKALQELC